MPIAHSALPWTTDSWHANNAYSGRQPGLEISTCNATWISSSCSTGTIFKLDEGHLIQSLKYFMPCHVLHLLQAIHSSEYKESSPGQALCSLAVTDCIFLYLSFRHRSLENSAGNPFTQSLKEKSVMVF